MEYDNLAKEYANVMTKAFDEAILDKRLILAASIVGIRKMATTGVWAGVKESASLMLAVSIAEGFIALNAFSHTQKDTKEEI